MAKMTIVRILLAATIDRPTLQMDVSNAFLHGDLEEKFYITLLWGYTQYRVGIIPSQEATSASIKRRACILVKLLYRLKQVVRQWFFKLFSVMMSFGFYQSKAD